MSLQQITCTGLSGCWFLVLLVARVESQHPVTQEAPHCTVCQWSSCEQVWNCHWHVLYTFFCFTKCVNEFSIIVTGLVVFRVAIPTSIVNVVFSIYRQRVRFIKIMKVFKIKHLILILTRCLYETLPAFPTYCGRERMTDRKRFLIHQAALLGQHRKREAPPSQR